MLLAAALYFTSSYSLTTPLEINYAAASLSPRDIGMECACACPRGRIDIIWSCIATTLAASWVSLHPNLPHPNDSWFKKSIRRVELMAWAIVAPELIIVWAMRQWRGARRMKKEFLDYQVTDAHNTELGRLRGAWKNTAMRDEEFKWTKTHGFFLQMGGFVLRESGKPNRVLGWKELVEYYKTGRIDLSDVTEARIKDHSKADGFAKALALLQILWFIIQCIARVSDKRLVLTKLELATAALAVLSLVMYFLWWNKPFNAEIPIIVTVVSSHTPRHCSIHHDDDCPTNERGGSIVYAQNLSLLANLKKYLQSLSVMNVLRRIDDLIGNSPEDPIDNQECGSTIIKVPTFYSIQARSILAYFQMLWASYSLAALFGAIHCLGWSTKIVFSSKIVLLVWRIASAVITGSPLVWSLFCVFTCFHRESESRRVSVRVYYILQTLLFYLTNLTMPFYALSRIILLILAFVELRDIPPGALATIQWGNFVASIH